jgi:serine protease
VDRTSGLLNNEKVEYLPCEAPGVLCVAGLEHDSLWRNTRSNFGPRDVDLWAPYTIAAGPLPEGRGTEEVRGTSGSSAFVAGIAALVKAANKDLSGAQIRTILIETAKASPDGRVAGIVQADAAVERALGSVTAPSLQIIQPHENASIPFNVSPTGEVGWVDGRPGAVPPTVEWRVNGTFAGSGLAPVLPAAAFGVGPATIEARATFLGGVVVTDTISVTRELPSSLRILLPTAGQALRPEDTYQRFLTEPVGPVQWSVDGIFFATGGDIASALPALATGPHTLAAVLSTPTGERRDEIQFTMLPRGLPKTTVTINQPAAGFIVELNAPATVNITALDGSAPTTGAIVWSVSNAVTGAVLTTQTSTSGTVTIGAQGRYVLTVSVQKLVDLNGDGVPETSVTVASDARAFTAQPTPT